MESGDKVYLTSEAARELGVAPITIRAWTKSGKLKAWRNASGSHRIFTGQELERVKLELAANRAR